MGKPMRALGLMSGTSMDGIDVALLDTDGQAEVDRGPALTFPYPDETRALLREALAHACGIRERRERPGMLPVAERALTELHAAAIAAFLRKTGISRTSIDVIGFHGHTVLHRPEERLSVQIGDGPLLAELVQTDVVYDLRAADLAAGGQGAPLVPVYHRALLGSRPERPIAVLNLGGVANVTFLGRNGALIAFDTGPGNALLDDFMAARAGEACDRNGAVAARGRVDEALEHQLLSHPYFKALPPKSLDRQAFAPSGAGSEPGAGPWASLDRLSLEDGAATLAAFTASAVARAREHFPEEPQLWVVSGGGRRNRTLMSMLAARVQNAVVPAEAAGLDGDSLEAEAWAYLSVRACKGLPITFPGTTGVPRPTNGGVLAKAPKA
jgi:anhydro-N-acetylmuramic acid kinase